VDPHVAFGADEPRRGAHLGDGALVRPRNAHRKLCIHVAPAVDAAHAEVVRPFDGHAPRREVCEVCHHRGVCVPAEDGANDREPCDREDARPARQPLCREA
jgi:hypothetical protein